MKVLGSVTRSVETRNIIRSSFSTLTAKTELYRRISPIGDPKLSIVPVLDQWLQQGQTVHGNQLRVLIKQLRSHRRFKHALEISMWMTDKRYIPLSPGDMAVRLDLIAKVHGVEEAEKQFNSISMRIKGPEVYSSLLNCYRHAKYVEKAEALMREIKDLGLPLLTVSYNVLLNLYYQIKDYGKLDSLMRDMEEKGVVPDQFTYGIRVSAYAATLDVEGLETTVKRMESDPNIVMDWATYCVLASGFRKARLKDKALLFLTKCEQSILKAHKRSSAYNFLLSEYAALGEKDEVLRICELYKKIKIQNKGYISMMTSFLKFNDLENAEKIFEEWESRQLTYYPRIPNLLIRAYCKKGLLEKAEDVMSRAVSKGCNPDALTWYHIGTGYIKKKQFEKAVELLRKAILTSQTGWKPSKPALSVCIDYLKGNKEVQVEEAEKQFNSISMRIKGQKVYGSLLNCYTHAKYVEKAEALMREIKDLGLPLLTVSYNGLLNLYYQIKDYGKLDALMRDMEEKGVVPDLFTYGIRVSAYAATLDVDGLETTVKRMESDPNIVMDWATYCVLASGFRKARLKDKALLFLTKCEQSILKAHKRRSAYNFLLSEYAALGEKDEVLRICELYKKIKIQNKGYRSMMTSFQTFNDLENAEKIFEEWEPRQLTYDPRIPNLLVRAYCKKGLLEKAEDVMSRAVSKGGNPDALTWYHIGTGYIKKEQFEKAVELLRKAILTSQTGWRPSKPALSVCIDYLKGNKEVQEAEDFIRILCDGKIISTDSEERLLKYVKDKSNLNVEWDISDNALE